LNCSRSEAVEEADVNCAITNNNSAAEELSDQAVLLASTLDGGLFALDKKTGAVRCILGHSNGIKSCLLDLCLADPIVVSLVWIRMNPDHLSNLDIFIHTGIRLAKKV